MRRTSIEVLLVATALAPSGCAIFDDPPLSADVFVFDASSDTHAAPKDAGVALEDSAFDTAPPDCAWLLADAGAPVDAPGVTPAQGWCAKAANPPECPSSKPAEMTACGVPGVACAYDFAGASFREFLCDPKDAVWRYQAFKRCEDACSLPDGGAPIADAALCGSLPDIECAETPYNTDFERADVRFAELATCCGLAENGVTVSLVDRCAVSIAFDHKNDRVAQCLVAVMNGRRFRCAPAGTCLSYGWGTK